MGFSFLVCICDCLSVFNGEIGLDAPYLLQFPKRHKGKKMGANVIKFVVRSNGWGFLEIHLDPDFFMINKERYFQSPLKNKSEEKTIYTRL